MKRRDLFKACAVAVMPAVFGDTMAPRLAQTQFYRPKGIRNPFAEFHSLPVTFFTEPLNFPLVMTEIP